MVRGVCYHVFLDGGSHQPLRVRNRFYSDTGIDEEARLSLSTWFARGYDLNIPQYQRTQYLQRVSSLTSQIKAWGLQNNIPPLPFVHDNLIEGREAIMEAAAG